MTKRRLSNSLNNNLPQSQNMVAAWEVKMGGIDVVYDVFQRQFYQDVFPDNLLALYDFENILKNDVAKRSV